MRLRYIVAKSPTQTRLCRQQTKMSVFLILVMVKLASWRKKLSTKQKRVHKISRCEENTGFSSKMPYAKISKNDIFLSKSRIFFQFWEVGDRRSVFISLMIQLDVILYLVAFYYRRFVLIISSSVILNCMASVGVVLLKILPLRPPVGVKSGRKRKLAQYAILIWSSGHFHQTLCNCFFENN